MPPSRESFNADQETQLTRRARRMTASLWALGAMLAAALFVGGRIVPAGRPIIRIDGVDPACYYNTAHSMLFDRDFDLTNQYGRLWPLSPKFIYVHPQTHRPTSPFPIGYSILQIPFLSAGHLLTLAIYGESDGYSFLCKAAYFTGNIFYLCAGLTFCFWFLRAAAQAAGAETRRADWSAWLVVLAIVPGTAVGYYSFSAMPHVVAFAACSAFLYAWWCARDSASVARWALVGLAAGMVTLCRWQAAIFLVIPLVYEAGRLVRSPREFFCGSWPRWLVGRVLAAGVLAAVLVPQFVQWKIIYGSYFTIPQGRGFLKFPPVHLGQVLFSTHHGWFVWTPLTLLGSLGLLWGCWRRRRAAWVCGPVLAALTLQCLLVGCLRYNWHGHHSFSIRMLTSSIPFVALGLVMWFVLSGRWVRRLAVVLGAGCVIWSLIFALEFRLDLIPKDGRLTLGELVGDKIFLRSLWQRSQAASAARAALDEGKPRAAIETALRARARFGVSRDLLAVLAQAYQRLGQADKESAAREELQKLLDSRLY